MGLGNVTVKVPTAVPSGVNIWPSIVEQIRVPRSTFQLSVDELSTKSTVLKVAPKYVAVASFSVMETTIVPKKPALGQCWVTNQMPSYGPVASTGRDMAIKKSRQSTPMRQRPAARLIALLLPPMTGKTYWVVRWNYRLRLPVYTLSHSTMSTPAVPRRCVSPDSFRCPRLNRHRPFRPASG